MPQRKFDPPKTIAQAEMRAINRSAVLEYLRLAKKASRTEIARQLKISKPTVMRIIDQLTETGLVYSTGEKEGKKGRARDLLALNEKENLVIGIDIGGSHISVAMVNIGGEISYKNTILVEWGSAEANFDILVDIVQSALLQPIEPNTRILGVAIGVPGIIERQSGVVKLAPSLNWYDFPLLNRLNQIIDFPLLIENDVNLAVLSEYWFGAGIGIRDLVMVAIGTGIGAGIILDGKLHRGFQELSGEIGYILPGIQFLDQQYPGFGALEIIASGPGIAKRGNSKLAEIDPTRSISDITAAVVFQAARDGEIWAVQTVAETVDYLSLAIANITVCFDPELIILGGGVSKSADMLIDPIKKHLSGVIPSVPRIEQSQLKEKAVILGAVVGIFQKVTDYAVVHSV